MEKCPSCGNSINPGQKFCTKCGTKLNVAPQQPLKTSANVCPSCGNVINPGQKFCTKCGTKLDVAPQQPNQSQQRVPDEKGFWDNITHLGTYIREGSAGVDRRVRQEREAELRERAADLGFEVNRTPQTGQPQQAQSQPQTQPEQPQSRRLVVDNTSVEGVNLVSGRAIWDIKKGEIARLVTEAEFANAEGLKGVIVQEGCTAMVFIDGQLVSMMQAGVYTFPAKTQAERQLQQRQHELELERNELDKERQRLEDEQRQKDEEYAQTFAARGVFGEVAAFGRGVMNFLFGKKKDESPEKHKQRVERTQQKLKMLPSPKICRVYIVSNRIINLIFGSKETAEGMVDFAPMVIPTKLVDINVGVSMQLEISNLQEFVKNYLADRKSVSILDIQKMLMPGIKATLTQTLRNLDYEQSGLPEPIVNNLKGRLQISCGERLFGIRVLKVLDITDSSADFERFRSVERELYASEKELGFLQRTGEFRNRLEQEQNKQAVDRAQNTEELRRALQAINTDSTKDQLLNKEELEQFVLLLESQQRIQKANFQKDEAIALEEVREALIDMKKSGLVKDDELAALEHQLLQGRMDRDDITAAHENEIEQRRIDRENVTEIMRIQASQKEALAQQVADFELSDNKMEHEMANALRLAQHQGNLAVAQLDTQRLLDAYNDQRQEHKEDRAWEQQQRQQQASNQQALFEQQLHEQQTQADYDRSEQSAQNTHNREMDRMAQLIAARDRAMAEMSRHDEAMMDKEVDIEKTRINAEMEMDADQLLAQRIQGMDAAAQAEFAKTLGSGKENELLKAQAEELEKRRLEENRRRDEELKRQQEAMANQQDFMLKMAEMMKTGMMGTAGAQIATQQAMADQQQQFQQQRYDDQVQIKQEYQQQAQSAQQRQDHAQDQAFGAMGAVATAAASNLHTQNTNINAQQPQQPQYFDQPVPLQPIGHFCPACGAVVPEGELFCGECGQKM